MSLRPSENGDRGCIRREDFPFGHDLIKLLEELGLKFFILGYGLDNEVDRRQPRDAVNSLSRAIAASACSRNLLFRDHTVDLLTDRRLSCFSGY